LELQITTHNPSYINVSVDQKVEQISFVDDHNVDPIKFFVVIPGNDKNVDVHGAKAIKEIKGLDKFALTSFDIGEAENLYNIDLHGTTTLQSVAFGVSKYLTSINLSDCSTLANIDFGFGTVDDRKNTYTNLQELNLSNCISYNGSLWFDGTDLRTMNLSNTGVDVINLANNLNLTDLNLTGCTSLKTVTISNCGITEFDASNLNSIENLTINKCDQLRTIILNNNHKLSKLNINDNPNLEKVVITNGSGQFLDELDLSKATKLSQLILTNSHGESTNITLTLRLPPYSTNGSTWTGLTELQLENSPVGAIVYGNEEVKFGVCDFCALTTE
jgi:hypothetical protein